MTRTFTAGCYLLVLTWLLQRMYEMMPAHQGWIIFGAMSGLALALGLKASPSTGGAAR